MTFKYADLNPEEYVDAIRAPEDYKLIQDEMVEELVKITGKKEPEMKVPDLEPVKGEDAKPYSWKKEDDQELRVLAVKHAFDFTPMFKEFLDKRPGSGLTVQQLREKWTQIETANYRRPEDPMDEVD